MKKNTFSFHSLYVVYKETKGLRFRLAPTPIASNNDNHIYRFSEEIVDDWCGGGRRRNTNS